MAMIEAYRIGVELVLGGDLAAGIEALIPGLSRLDSGLVQANASAKALAAALGSVAATAPGIGQAAAALERLTAAMASMNQAGAVRQPAAPLPQDRDGAAVARAVREPGAVKRKPGDPVANTAGVLDAAASGGTSSALPASPAAQRPALVRALVQAVQPVAPAPSPGGVPESGAPPAPAKGPMDRPVVAPLSAAAPQRNSAVRSGDGGSPSAAVSRPRPAPIVTAAPPVGLEPTLPVVAIDTPGAGIPAVRREAVAGIAASVTAARQVRDVVLPRAGIRTVVEPPATGQPDAGPQAMMAPAAIPTVIVPPAVPTRAPLPEGARANPRAGEIRMAPTPKRAWPIFTAALDRARTAPATQAVGSPQEAKVAPPPAAIPALLHDRRPALASLPRAGVTPPPRAGRPATPSASPTPMPVNALLPTAPAYHPQASQAGPVIQHVTVVQLDERTIARAVTRQQLRMMGGQVSGTLRPDPSVAPQYGAHLLEQ